MPRRTLWLLALLFVWGCEESATEPPHRLSLVVDQVEANLIALQISAELEVPAELASAVGEDLRLLREDFGVTVPEVLDIYYRAPWAPTDLLLIADEPTARSIRNGDYSDWNDLNATLDMREVDDLRNDSFALRFGRPLHPCRLRELYASLPGVLLAEPNGIVGDGSNLYAWEHEGMLTYLFRKAWGDCPAGCIYDEFWYFRGGADGAVFVGAWNPQENPTPPEWWQEARQNIEFHIGHCHK